MSPETRLDLRATARDHVRAQVADRALDLFAEHGFDATPVDEICASVGISPRTFFRYFPSKEDAVVGDPMPLGRDIAAALAARPSDEDPWTSMRAGLQLLVDALPPERGLVLMRVIMSAPSLRARHLEKHLAWGALFEPIIRERLVGADATRRLRASVVVHGSLAALDAAFDEWVGQDGASTFETVLDESFAALRG